MVSGRRILKFGQRKSHNSPSATGDKDENHSFQNLRNQQKSRKSDVYPSRPQLAKSTRRHIPTPIFKEIGKGSGSGFKKSTINPRKCTKVRASKTLLESQLNLEALYESRHKPLELAEKRARKREAEIDRYNSYIARLRHESPELWPWDTTKCK